MNDEIGVMVGIRAERAAIVAWLRMKARPALAMGGVIGNVTRDAFLDAADAIERGQHIGNTERLDPMRPTESEAKK